MTDFSGLLLCMDTQKQCARLGFGFISSEDDVWEAEHSTHVEMTNIILEVFIILSSTASDVLCEPNDQNQPRGSLRRLHWPDAFILCEGNCMRFLAFFFLVISPNALAVCAFSSDELAEGQPIVKVAPAYPVRALRKEVTGCVVLGYALKEHPDFEGGLSPYNIVVLSSTDAQRHAFEKAAKKALSKWLFSAKRNESSDDIKYYAVFPFEIEEEKN